MAEAYYDIIVIGGGIHGAGVAQAAAAHGYSVLLLEKSEIGAATSSKSSKLIHGGLRYLETFQFGLVKECLHERALLLRNAPDLVKLLPFYIPIYQYTRRRPWQIHLGLQLYRSLSGFDRNSGFVKLDSQRWQSLNGLDKDGLQAVYQYYDAQTDDAALTNAVLHSAQQLDAEVLVPATFQSAELHQHGCDVHVTTRGQEKSYSCAVLVNAAGAWVNEVLKNCTPQIRTLGVDYVQGTHVVINEAAKAGVFYLEAPQDRRAVFVIPWQGQCMVGTTETIFHGDANNVKPLAEEIRYLLDIYNRYFVPAKEAPDIIDSFAGLRVLPRTSGAPSKRVRDTLLLTDSDNGPRLITLYGGKLTAYRVTAEKAIQCVHRSLPHRKPRADTRSLPLQPIE
jgi:glycerol-3-phosphate dehydrogenase